jgi:glycogen(starch) synthase
VETIHSAVNWRELGHPVVRRSRRSAVTQHVAVSDGLRDELIAGGELSAAEVTAIPNGIRVGEFRTPPAIIRFPTLGTAARFDRGKGLEYLLEAFRELRRAWPQARLVLAGDGPTRADLVELVNAHDLAPAVEMPGYVPDLRAVLRQLDVFVLPSLHEAFGLALGEAMAEGVPVVASNLPGPASLCRDGQEGLLVPPADARAIAAACARLLADAELRGRLARGGYERVRSQFTLARMGQAHLALYRGLLERHEVRCISRFADSEAGARLPDLAQSD